jgi:hypothetical protein
LTPDSIQPPPGLARRLAGYLAGAIGIVLFAASLLWFWGEATWGRFTPLTPHQAFADGSFGLEIAPLKYILVASSVSNKALGDGWPRRFGFLSRPGAPSGLCEADAPANLPVGFSVSNRLPGNATPLPLKFVGLSCAACHATSAGGAVILGAGSQTADVIAFGDAFQNAVADPSLDADAIFVAYDQQCGTPHGLLALIDRFVERFFINRWLAGARAQTRDNSKKYDQPYHGADIRNPANIPTGPSRTRPFRSVVRNTLDFPGEKNVAYSKVPLAAMQDLKRWSQFDGSIGDPVIRSMIAVFTSGTTRTALNEPQIADNIAKAATYTLRLGVDPPLPRLAQAFPNAPKPSDETIGIGRALYMRACDSCHGHAEDAGWVMPARIGIITPLAVIKTDPARLTFRYADMLHAALAAALPAADPSAQQAALSAELERSKQNGDFVAADWWKAAKLDLEMRSREFPAGHRMAFPADELVKRDGYQNAPIPFVWLRAPYLHNGSVPTLRALLGLDERLAQFCRGNTGYDPVAIGVTAPRPGPQGCGGDAPFLFDTAQPGNSNEGHRFPEPGSASPAELEALLAYLGTL